MQLVTHHLTSRGGRPANEDALKEVTDQESALLLLADGLGGHGGGAMAARQCVETIASAFSRAPGLSDASLQTIFEEADRAVAALRRDRRKSPSSMRTTLALLAICGTDARWAHVGDSRVYWFRDNVLMQRTRDHSVLELLMGVPDHTSVAPPDKADRHRLLRALGAGEGCRAELSKVVVTLKASDAFLLCSDGVWTLLSDAEITECLCKAVTPLEWCVALERQLRENLKCNRFEEQDNYSMIAVMLMP
jgi:serine/threonine protein phosphatase PrpC